MIDLIRDVVPRLEEFYPKVYYKKLRKDVIIAPHITGAPIAPYRIIPSVVKFRNMDKYVLVVNTPASAISFQNITDEEVQCKIYELLIDTDDYLSRIANYYGEDYEPTIAEIEATGIYPSSDFTALPTSLGESKVVPPTNWYLLEATLKSTGSPIESMITSYMDVPRSVPMLTGHTGIAKSSIIHSVASRLNKEANNKYGYREHIVKVGYLDRLDILGYVTTRDIEGLGQVSEYAPMYELMISEDRFVDSARKALDEFDSPPTDSRELIAYEKLAYYAKTPILFFDEINRTPRGIFNIITTLFDQRRIQEFTFNTAKLVAAANIVTDPSTGDILDSDLYKTATVTNPAIIERLKPIAVELSDVISSFQRMYREKKWTIGPVIDKYIEDVEGFHFLHDVREEHLEKSNTTLRTWEYLEKYTNWINKTNNHPLKDVLRGIGLDLDELVIVSILTDIFGSNTLIDKDSPEVSDPMQVFIDHCYGAGLPTMLVGRFGIAKTARIEQTAKREEAEVLRISLSATDRTLINGTPTPISILDAAFSKSLKDTEAYSKLQGVLASKSDIPLRTTKSMPNAEAVARLQNAVKNNKKLLIVFDEFNMGSPVVQSAVFGAISDYTLFGVTLDPENTRFMCTGNVSTDDVQYAGAEQLDAATVARFSMFRKDDIDEKDVALFTTYAKSHFTPAINNAISTMDVATLKSLVSEMPEDPQLGTSISCSRSFEIASNIIERDPLFRGIVPNTEPTSWGTPDAVKRMCFSVPDQTITFKNGVEYPIEDIPKLWNEEVDLRDEILEVIPEIQKIVYAYRRRILATTFSSSMDSKALIDTIMHRLDEVSPTTFLGIYGEAVTTLLGATHIEILASTIKTSLEKKIIENSEELLPNLRQVMEKYVLNYGGWTRVSLYETLKAVNANGAALVGIPIEDPDVVKELLSDLVSV